MRRSRHRRRRRPSIAPSDGTHRKYHVVFIPRCRRKALCPGAAPTPRGTIEPLALTDHRPRFQQIRALTGSPSFGRGEQPKNQRTLGPTNRLNSARGSHHTLSIGLPPRHHESPEPFADYGESGPTRPVNQFRSGSKTGVTPKHPALVAVSRAPRAHPENEDELDSERSGIDRHASRHGSQFSCGMRGGWELQTG
jgi:hypothetical protein